MKVNQLTNELAITADRVRFYTRIGLLNSNKPPVNGYRIYNNNDKSHMQFILSAGKLDFSVDEIKVIFSKTDHGENACKLVRV